LQMTASRDPNIYSRVELFKGKLVYDAGTYRNVWIIVLLILLGPLALGIARYYIETTRWANSEFAKS